MLNLKNNEKRIVNLVIVIINIIVFVCLVASFFHSSIEFTTSNQINIILYFMNSVLAILTILAVKIYHGISKTKDLYILLLYFVNLTIELILKFIVYFYFNQTRYKIFVGSLLFRTFLIILWIFKDRWGISNIIKSNKSNNIVFSCITTITIIYDMASLEKVVVISSLLQFVSIGIILIMIGAVFYNLKRAVKEQEILNSMLSLSFIFLSIKLMYKLDNFLFMRVDEKNIFMEEILMFLALIFLFFGSIIEIYKYTMKYKEIEETNNIYYKIINQNQSMNISIYRNKKLVYLNQKARREFKGENLSLEQIQESIEQEYKGINGLNTLFEYVKRREDIDMIIEDDRKRIYSLSYQSITPIHVDKEDEEINIYITKEITEEIKAKKVIELNNKKFDILNEYLNDGIIVTDENLEITYVNRYCEKLLGEKSKNMLGKDIISFFEFLDLGAKKSFEVTLKNNKNKSFKIQVEKIDDYEGITVGYVFICLNEEKSEISDEQKIENSIVKKDAFANLSHELRTPIHIISSSLQLLNSQKNNLNEGEFIEAFERYESTMKINSLRLLKIVNDIIDISKLDVGAFKLNKKKYNIVTLVENISTSVVPYMKVKNINFIFDTNEEERFIECDQEKVERIVLNLISNAIKFTKEDGEINVIVEVEKDFVKIKVKDTGIGIEKEKCKDIFERFVQCDNGSITRKGSGIGLSLVKSLVEMHGGYVYVESELGRGSEFVVCLPNSSDEENELAILSGENIDIELLGDISVEFSDIEK